MAASGDRRAEPRCNAGRWVTVLLCRVEDRRDQPAAPSPGGRGLHSVTPDGVGHRRSARGMAVRSTDLRGWSSPEPVFVPRPGGWGDSASVASAHPDRNVGGLAGDIPRCPGPWPARCPGSGLLLLDLDHPTMPTPTNCGCTTARRIPASRWPPHSSPSSSPTCWSITPTKPPDAVTTSGEPRRNRSRE